jgi:arylsulfatase A-like enzyme
VERAARTDLREQNNLGVIPQHAELTPWPENLLKSWDKLTDVEKKLFIKQADVYAAYLAYTDNEIGRVVQAVEDMGKLDNTLIIYISGDNGASTEGTLTGTPSELLSFNGIELTAEQQMPWYDVWGTNQTYNHMAVGWAWAFDTPYKWTKQIPSFFGGTRNGMAVSWPAKIKEKGGTRWQFHHVIDIVPTLLEACGIPAPNMVDERASALPTPSTRPTRPPRTRPSTSRCSACRVCTTTGGCSARCPPGHRGHYSVRPS